MSMSLVLIAVELIELKLCSEKNLVLREFQRVKKDRVLLSYMDR